jgi:hypothetical protein
MKPPQSEQRPAARALNVEPLLDLGDLVYFHFRGRAYCVPPLPARQGERILDTWLELQEYGETLTRELLPRYYAGLRRLESLIWQSIRPEGRFRRLLYHLKLLPNPYRRATEREVVERTLFLLERRTSMSVSRPRPAKTRARAMTQRSGGGT